MKSFRKIWKVFLVWDFEKEEDWLNEMAQNGWALTGVGFCNYSFVQCKPGEYTIRLEQHPKEDSYIEFMEETGAEYIGRIVQWLYFRKKTELGEFDIFSDIDSRIEHLKRISRVLAAFGLINIILGMINTLGPNHMGGFNLLCGCLLMYGLGRIHGKKEALEKERLLHE